MKNTGTKSRLHLPTKMTINGPFIQIHMYLHISKIKRSLTSQHPRTRRESAGKYQISLDSPRGPRPNHKLFLIARLTLLFRFDSREFSIVSENRVHPNFSAFYATISWPDHVNIYLMNQWTLGLVTQYSGW
jgi:hypothetical protein